MKPFLLSWAVVAGAVLVTVGFWQVAESLGWIAAGVSLIAVAVGEADR